MKSELTDFKNPPALTHLKRLTTRDGLIQHADLEVPDPSHGYSIDDNARAIIATLWYHRIYQDPSVIQLLRIYFGYLTKVEKEGGSFHNFLSFTEQILDSEGSEDSIGRTIWALGELAGNCPEVDLCQLATEMMKRCNIHRHLDHPHLRTKAYILLGLLASGDHDEAKLWADKLAVVYNENATKSWKWFENHLSYANAVLPFAMAKAAIELKSETYLNVAKESFDWLDKQCRIDGVPSPIGQNGWYFKDNVRADYDQQPVDAAKMVLAATALHQATHDQYYLKTALEWMSWYNGNNIQKVSVKSDLTNGIYDAVTPGGVNKNQGAESIVTYLLAYLELSKMTQNA